MDKFKETIRDASLLSGVTEFGKQKIDAIIENLENGWETTYKHKYSEPNNIRVVFFNADKVSSVHTSLLQLAKEKGKDKVFATLFDSEIRRVIPIEVHLEYERDILLRKPVNRKMMAPKMETPQVREEQRIARMVPPKEKPVVPEPVVTPSAITQTEPTLMESPLTKVDIDALIKINQDMDIED